MGTIILLECYVGLSDFSFETTCTGRVVEESELREKSIITDDLIRRTKDSSYIPEWFEVKEGDQIRVVRRDDDGELDETFVVGSDLPDPPQKRDDLRAGMRVYDYLVQHCKKAA